MARKKFDENNWTIEEYINDIPIEEYEEEERDKLLKQMWVNAVHSIGFMFEYELNNALDSN